jgi:general secretion pathway protein K
MKKQQFGISLIIVLWMLTTLTVIALAFSHSVRTEVMLAANYQNQAKALGLAEAGIWRSTAMVLNKASAQASGEHIRLDGFVYELSSYEGELSVSLQSTNGLVDINRAPPEVIKKILETVVPTSEHVETITDSLLDWRDDDNLKRLFGAETDDYVAQALTYGAKNGLVNSVAELGRINGMTPAIYHALSPMMTVYSGQARIDITSAPKNVLLTLPGMTASVVDSIIDGRASGATNVNLGMIPAETRQYIGAGQDAFIRISSKAKVNGSISGIIAVIQFESGPHLPVTIMSWRQGLDDRFNE